MKQFESHGVTFFYREDLSGDVHMQHERGAGFTVPSEALRAFAAELLRQHAERKKRTETLLIAETTAAKLRAMGVEINALQFLTACAAADEELSKQESQPAADAFGFPARCLRQGPSPLQCCFFSAGHSGKCSFEP